MKKFVTLALLFATCVSFAQVATDENGNKVFNGSSVAIFTRVTKFAVGGVVDIKKVMPGELEEELRVTLNTMATSAAQSQGVQVVNRDDATFKKTQQWLDESKSEDYLDGLSIRARSIGATHLLVQDATFYTYGNAYIILEIMYNVISVQTNISSRNIRRYRLNVTGSEKEISDMLAQEKAAIRKYFMDAFPGFFVLQKTSGNTALLAVTSAFGIDTQDKVCFYNWENIKLPLHGLTYDFSKMELVSVGTNPKLTNGYLQVKLDRKLLSTNSLVIKLGDCQHSEIGTYHHVPVAFVDLKFTGNPADDFCKKQVNNAVYNALYDFACINLIESDELSLVKKERELQKSEEFIDGSFIEQFKASGAQYVLSISEFSQNQRFVKFKLSALDVSTGEIAKDYLIECHISNIDEVIKYHINLLFVSPIAIGENSKKQIKVYPILPIASNEGEPFSILFNKPTKNPMTGQTIYNRVEIAKCTLTRWNIQEYVMTITKITSKEDFDAIGSIKGTGLFYLKKDLPEPKNIMTDNTENNWKKQP